MKKILLILFFISIPLSGMGNQIIISNQEQLWVQGRNYNLQVKLGKFFESNSLIEKHICMVKDRFKVVQKHFTNHYSYCGGRGYNPNGGGYLLAKPIKISLRISVTKTTKPGTYPLQLKFLQYGNPKSRKPTKIFLSNTIKIKVISSKQTLSQVRENLLSHQSKKTRISAVYSLSKYGKSAFPLIKWAFSIKDLADAAFYVSKTAKCDSCERLRQKYFDDEVFPKMKEYLRTGRYSMFESLFSKFKPYSDSLLADLYTFAINKNADIDFKYWAMRAVYEKDSSAKNLGQFTKIALDDIQHFDKSVKNKLRYNQGILSNFMMFVKSLPQKIKSKILTKALNTSQEIQSSILWSLNNSDVTMEQESILIEILKGPENRSAHDAAKFLTAIKSEKAIAFLEQKLNLNWLTYIPFQSDPNFQVYAKALYNIGSKKAKKALLFYRNDIHKKLIIQNSLIAKKHKLIKREQHISKKRLNKKTISHKPTRKLIELHNALIYKYDLRFAFVYGLSQLKELAIPALNDIDLAVSRLKGKNLRQALREIMVIPSPLVFRIINKHPYNSTLNFIYDPCRQKRKLNENSAYAEMIITNISKKYAHKYRGAKVIEKNRRLNFSLSNNSEWRKRQYKSCLVEDLKKINSISAKKLLKIIGH